MIPDLCHVLGLVPKPIDQKHVTRLRFDGEFRDPVLWARKIERMREADLRIQENIRKRRQRDKERQRAKKAQA